MARIARIIVPGMPHHVIQRGNRRQNVFIEPADKQYYLDLLRAQTREQGVKIWAYCLMDNHVHLVLVPGEAGSLSTAVGETHKRYTRMVNFREKWRGHLWECRYKSFVMDERYLFAVVRYVENNPVRAKIVQEAEEYHWSSAGGHIHKGKDRILDECFLEEEIADWREYLRQEDLDEGKKIRGNVNAGRPLGDEGFIDRVEKHLGRTVRRQKPGPKSG